MNKFLKTINVKLLILAFYLFQCLSISAGEIDFGVSQDSLQLLQNGIVDKIESEQTTNVLDDVLKIEDLLDEHPELSSDELEAINFYIKGLSAYNFLDYEKALEEADNAILYASKTNDAIIRSLAEHIKALALYGLNDYPKAEKHFKKAIEHLDESYANKTMFKLNRDAFKVDNYYYIAILNYSPTLQWFNDSGKFLDRSKIEILETAIENAEEALKYISFSNAKKDKRFPMYLLLADSNLKLNRIEETKKHLAFATNYLQNGSATLLRHYWFNRCYAEYYEVTQNYEQSTLFYKRALELIRKYSLKVNSEFKQNNRSSINYMTNQLSVSLMKTKNELIHSKEEKGMVLIVLTFVIIATLLVIVIYQWRLVRLKNSINKELTLRNSGTS
jgi:tetratricopeptide (TPR) repeat protein